MNLEFAANIQDGQKTFRFLHFDHRCAIPELNFISTIQKTCSDLQIPPSARLLIGVSGGIDSMVLLHAMLSADYKVTTAHVNFKLRGEESDLDEAHVRAWCASHHIPCLVLEADTTSFADQHALNIQQAARRIRYQWWEELIRKGEFDYIATAHHQDDQVETVLMNFMRGTGLKGLPGIPARRDQIIRPLLGVPRSDIEQYAKENDIPFRNDSSNAKDQYLRNSVRHHLLPLMQKLVPGIKERILHTSKRAALEWAAWDHVYKQWQQASVSEKDSGIAITVNTGEASFILRWLETKGMPWSLAHDYVMAEKTTGEPLQYMDLTLSRTKDGFFFQPFSKQHHTIEIESAGSVSGPGFEFTIEKFPASAFDSSKDNQFPHSMEFVSAYAIRFPLTLRPMQRGDFFQPLGMQGKSKKLQDLLVDRKMAMHEKQAVWVLANPDHIIWVIGIQLDERAKVKPGDTAIYKLSFQRH